MSGGTLWVEVLLRESHACTATAPCTQGLERTEHEGFGGGNTAWEEEKLSKYQHR